MMFRRIANRLTAAVNGTDVLDEKIRTLEAMGFDAQQARSALGATEGNVESAAELLLAAATGNTMISENTPTATPSFPRRNQSPPGINDDVALRNALEESRQSEEQRRYREAQEASLQDVRRNPTRTAAGNKAAVAAAQRAVQSTGMSKPLRSASGGLSAHHPDVKVPAKLEHKSKEEQIIRCADRLKPHPSAVDTLHRALTTIRKNPGEDKYRRIDKTNAGYQRALGNAPGAEALLKTMNFRPHGAQSLVLDRSSVDAALLYLGISALEDAKQSKEYKEEKRNIAFRKEFLQIRESSDTSTEEAIKRADFMSRCPSEPQNGALMQVKVGDNLTIRRRFDGDDCLQDVLNWLGGNGSVIPNKLLTRQWCLVDLNRYPITAIDCEKNLDKTLQYIGFWPSGKLEIRPSSEEWLMHGKMNDLMGSSRGLASAPTDALR